MAGGRRGGGSSSDVDDDDDFDDYDVDGGGRPPPPPLTLARCLFHAGEARRQNGEFRAANAFLEEAAAIVAAAMESSTGKPLRAGLLECLPCAVAFRQCFYRERARLTARVLDTKYRCKSGVGARATTDNWGGGAGDE